MTKDMFQKTMALYQEAQENPRVAAKCRLAFYGQKDPPPAWLDAMEPVMVEHQAVMREMRAGAESGHFDSNVLKRALLNEARFFETLASLF